jgi:hypothetical protein
MGKMRTWRNAGIDGPTPMSAVLAPHRAMFVEMLVAAGAQGDPEAIFDRMLEIADQDPDGVLAWLIEGAKRAQSGIRAPNAETREVLERYGMPIREEPKAHD